MLRQTFIHVPGVGSETERKLWERNIASWSGFRHCQPSGISRAITSKIADYLTLSEKALRSKQAGFFANTLPKREWWRLYDEFRERTVYLDIETTGLSLFYDYITIIGLFNGTQFKVYVSGHNLGEFRDEISKYELLVTYNGTMFDLPFLRKEFKQLSLPPIHIDLRFLLRRLGLSGGLKRIEEQLNIRREPEIEGIDGLGATILWNKYVRGDLRSLELLAKYNLADVTNLKTLMEYCYQELRQRLFYDHVRAYGHGNTVTEAKQYEPRRLKSLLTTTMSNIRARYDLTETQNLSRITIDAFSAKLKEHSQGCRVVGIDLAASERRKSGWAVLEDKTVRTGLFSTDEEIVNIVKRLNPTVVSIDSPLSLPIGRDCVEDTCECRRFGITRECERVLRRRGINVFPCLLPSMKGLTQRGIMLSKLLRKLGFQVIESYPGVAQDILGIPRKKVSVVELKYGLLNFGLGGDFTTSHVTHDELDAITSALVGSFYLAGEYEAIGTKQEGYLIIPRYNRYHERFRTS